MEGSEAWKEAHLSITLAFEKIVSQQTLEHKNTAQLAVNCFTFSR